MLPKDTKLLRLASARLDMGYSLDAYAHLREIDPRSELFYHCAVSFAACYGRPFTENNGLGNLKVEYPSFPDFPESEMNLRHQRMLDLRHKFVAHSSCEGTRVMILPPGAQNPMTKETTTQYDHLVGKRSFGDIRFYDWLKDVVVALKCRLDADVRKRIIEVAGTLKAADEMETGYDAFSWTVPKMPPSP